LPKSCLAAELERLLGVRVQGSERVESGGYGRVSAHWRVRLADRRSLFVKQALTSDARAWLRQERLVYENVTGSFMPAYFGAHDHGGEVFLVIEDLSGADWPPPWSSERIEAVLAALAALRSTPPPEGLRRLEDERENIVGWPAVRDDPEPLLSTGICTHAWLEQALPVLLLAAEEAELDGGELLHLDVRSDNLCLRGGAAVLVDWNLASVGNGLFDVAFWLPSLRLEGGPEPWEVLPGAGPLAAVVAGFFAARCGLPPPSGAPTVREFQLRQLEVALPWAARELGQAPP
jgi:aminoglycoside phosphotransferase (APT) family kinase protein